MEAELAKYAETALEMARNGRMPSEEESVVSIEERMSAFDVKAARQSIQFMGEAFREMGHEIREGRHFPLSCNEEVSDEEDDQDDNLDKEEIEARRQWWIEQQQRESSRLHQQHESLLDNVTNGNPSLGFPSSPAPDERSSLLPRPRVSL